MGSPLQPLNMKILISSALLLALLDVSFQGFAPPVIRPAPQPVCRKVPKEVCEQVPKTIYDTVTRRECHDVADTVCADVQERKCQISQRPVQESVSRQQCSLQYRKDCQTANDIEKRCQQEFQEECNNVPEVVGVVEGVAEVDVEQGQAAFEEFEYSFEEFEDFFV